MKLSALVEASRAGVVWGPSRSAWRGSSAGPQLIADPLGSRAKNGIASRRLRAAGHAASRTARTAPRTCATHVRGLLLRPRGHSVPPVATSSPPVRMLIPAMVLRLEHRDSTELSWVVFLPASGSVVGPFHSGPRSRRPSWGSPSLVTRGGGVSRPRPQAQCSTGPSVAFGRSAFGHPATSRTQLRSECLRSSAWCKKASLGASRYTPTSVAIPEIATSTPSGGRLPPEKTLSLHHESGAGVDELEAEGSRALAQASEDA
jgi:hypothetical protein